MNERLHTEEMESTQREREREWRRMQAENRARNELNQRSPLPRILPSLSLYECVSFSFVPLDVDGARRGANFAMILIAPSSRDDNHRPCALLAIWLVNSDQPKPDSVKDSVLLFGRSFC